MSSPAIRKCSLADVDLLVGLGRDFHEYSIWGHTDFDTDAVRGMVSAIVQGAGVAYTNDTGFIAGMLTPLYFSPHLHVATELAWWAPSGGGAELRMAFEAWAKEQGAFRVQCSALADETFTKVDKNFKQNGYKLAELSYVKALD